MEIPRCFICFVPGLAQISLRHQFTGRLVLRQDKEFGLAVVDLAKDPLAAGPLARSTTVSAEPFFADVARRHMVTFRKKIGAEGQGEGPFSNPAIFESPLIRPTGHLLTRRGEGTLFHSENLEQKTTSVNLSRQTWRWPAKEQSRNNFPMQRNGVGRPVERNRRASPNSVRHEICAVRYF